jgi:hypothetical protein
MVVCQTVLGYGSKLDSLVNKVAIAFTTRVARIQQKLAWFRF